MSKGTVSISLLMGATTLNKEHYSHLSSLAVDQFYLLSILSSRAVDDGQTAGYEVILDVHDDDRRPGSDDLLDPAIPAVDKLLLAHTAVTGHVEDHEEVRHLLAVQGVGLTFLILEQSRAQSCELVDVDGFVSSNMFYIKKDEEKF